MAVLLAGAFMLPAAYAQFQSGGVDQDGQWHAGEGLKHGDYFSYRMCHVDYKECAPFMMNIWIAGDIQSGTEQKWLAKVVVYDGNKTIVGDMELGKLAPEPTGGSPELGVYRSAFKSSIVWMSAFATMEDPRDFRDVSWGKIANIGGEQILPTSIETISVPAGMWDTVLITWKTGGKLNQVWISDNFPFPIKADTYTHVSEGIPPSEYKFELVDYEQGILQNPFEDIAPSSDTQSSLGCPQVSEKSAAFKKSTKNYQYQVHIFYGPEYPMQGCEMEWLIKFINKVDDTEFLNQVQYDLLVVGENEKPIRSIAEEEGRKFLYSPSGQSIVNMTVKEDPGTASYVVWIYGLAPDFVVPSDRPDYVKIEIPITASNTRDANSASHVPSWVKTNAGWWAEGQIDDDSFVQGIQFLIREGIMTIPATVQNLDAGSNDIPSWVKTNAGWWAEGQIDDDSFVQGIQFLIREGIMTISANGN